MADSDHREFLSSKPIFATIRVAKNPDRPSKMVYRGNDNYVKNSIYEREVGALCRERFKTPGASETRCAT